MAHSSVQDQLENLDVRVRRLEQGTGSQGWWNKFTAAYRAKDESQRLRFIGWFMIAASTTGILGGWVNAPVVATLFSLCLVIGFWLLVRAAGLFDMSESTHQLYEEYRTRKASSAHQVHKAAHIHTASSTAEVMTGAIRVLFMVMGGLVLGLVLAWFLTQRVADPLTRFLPILVVVLGCLYYAISQKKQALLYFVTLALYGLLAMSDLPLYSLAIILVLTPVLAYVGWSLKDRFFPGLLAFLSYASLLRWLWNFTQTDNFPRLLPVTSWMNERYLILAGSLLFFVVLVAPFIARRREIEERESVRFVLATSTIGYVLTFGWLAEYLGSYRWFVTLFSLVILLACFGYLSWVRYQRFSYAKYFLALALATLVIFAYTYLDTVAIALLWFIAGVVTTTLGFLLNSYTARMTGMLLLALTVAQYIVGILPNPEQYAGPVLLHERVWLGIIISIYLPVLALWFKDTKLRGTETKLVPVYINTLFSASLLLLFAMLTLESTGMLQTLWWIILGMGGLLVGVWQRVALLRGLSALLLGGAFAKFFLVDTDQFSTSGQVAALAAFGALLIIGGLLAHRYQRLIRLYFS